MVMPLSDGNAPLFGPPFGAALVSVLLVVTNFLASLAMLVGFDAAGAFAGTFFCASGFAGTGLACLTGAGPVAFGADSGAAFFGAAFFAGGFLAALRTGAAFDAGFTVAFFAGIGLAVFFDTTDLAFAAN